MVMPQEKVVTGRLTNLALGSILGVFYAAVPAVIAQGVVEMVYTRPPAQSERTQSPSDVSLNLGEYIGGLEIVSGRVLDVVDKGNRLYEIAVAQDNDQDGRIDRNSRVVHSNIRGLEESLQPGDNIRMEVSQIGGSTREVQSFYSSAPQ